MSAQTFNGVTVGGDALRPTIVNHSAKPVMSYVIRKNLVGGGVVEHMVTNVNWMIKNTPILPGEERPLSLGSFRSGRLRRRLRAIHSWL